jgi:hypothetical protein
MKTFPKEFTRAEIEAMSPAAILLHARFHELCGEPLRGITQFDIEWAQCSWEIDRDFREKLRIARGEPSPLDQYKTKLKANRTALLAKRRSAEMSRTPAWADLDAIKAVYAQARAVTERTGIPHHVDHEIPLQGKLVSGLHVHNNLQILTKSENSRKCNKFEVEA